jgi:hypothetical protein
VAIEPSHKGASLRLIDEFSFVADFKIKAVLFGMAEQK